MAKNCPTCNKPGTGGSQCFNCQTAKQGTCQGCNTQIPKEMEPYCAPCFNAGKGGGRNWGN